MQILRHDVEFLYIPQTVETGPVEGFLAETISPQFSPDGVCRGAADISERANPLQAQTTRLKGLAEGHEGIIAVPVGEILSAVVAAQQGRRESRVVVLGMPGKLGAELVVAEAEGEHGRVFAHRLEVVHLIETAIVRKAQDSLFGDDVIEFEFPTLVIKPTRAKEIAEAHIGGFKMKRTVVLRSRHKQKADVLSERPGGQNVQAPNVKTMGGQPALGGDAGWERVSDVCVVHALAMPVRGDAERYRPIGWVLVDRKSTRLNSSHGYISYAVFCLKKKKKLVQYHVPRYMHCAVLLIHTS